MFSTRELLRIGYRWLLALAACVAVGLALMVAVASLPQQQIKNNLVSSAQYERTSGDCAHVTFLQKVHYTESIMAMLACTMDEESPFTSALESRTHTLTRFMEKPIDDFRHFMLNGETEMKAADYNRYWHGYLVPLRPLLYFFDLPTIRHYSLYAFSILATVVLMMIQRQFGTSIFLIFLIGLLHAGWFGALPYSLDQNKVYYIIFISSIILLASNTLYQSRKWLPVFFLCIGACTSFLDFLTAPVLTLATPLLLVFLKRGTTPIMQQFLTIILCSSAWCLGYAGMWAAKWVLCALFTNCEVFDIVKGSLKERSIGVVEFDFAKFCRCMLYPIPDHGYTWWVGVSTALVLALGGHLAFLFLRYRQAALNNIGYFVVMLFPVIWFFATRQHTLIHLVFTYRIMEGVILGYGIFAIKIYRDARETKLKKLASMR